MARKHQEEKEPNHERWLLTYSDLITLLMIFFIIMYSMSRLDVKRYNVLAQQLVNALGRGGGAEEVMTITNPPGAVVSNKWDFGEVNKQLQNLKITINEEYKGSLTIQQNEDGLLISMKELLYFKGDSAVITPQMKEVIEKLGSVFIEHTDNNVEVYGFSDDITPSATGIYPSNWHLAAARAGNVVNFITGELRNKRYKQLKKVLGNNSQEFDKYYNYSRFIPISRGDSEIFDPINIIKQNLNSSIDDKKEQFVKNKIDYKTYQMELVELTNKYNKKIDKVREDNRKIDILILRSRADENKKTESK